MRKHILLISLALVLVAHGAQDKPKDQPQLKDSVKLELVTLKLNQTQTQLQLVQLITQYRQLEAQAQALSAALKDSLATALKRSDINEKKYTLNPQTLEVTSNKDSKESDDTSKSEEAK